MIELLKQTTEYYCTTEEESKRVIQERVENSSGQIIKQTIENKKTHYKLTITEEYNSSIELAKEEEEKDPNEYYDMFDSDGKVIEWSDKHDSQD